MTADGLLQYCMGMWICVLFLFLLVLVGCYVIVQRQPNIGFLILYSAMIIQGMLIVLQGILADEVQLELQSSYFYVFLISACFFIAIHLYALYRYFKDHPV